MWEVPPTHSLFEETLERPSRVFMTKPDLRSFHRSTLSVRCTTLNPKFRLKPRTHVIHPMVWSFGSSPLYGNSGCSRPSRGFLTLSPHTLLESTADEPETLGGLCGRGRGRGRDTSLVHSEVNENVTVRPPSNVPSWGSRVDGVLSNRPRRRSDRGREAFEVDGGRVG